MATIEHGLQGFETGETLELILDEDVDLLAEDSSISLFNPQLRQNEVFSKNKQKRKIIREAKDLGLSNISGITMDLEEEQPNYGAFQIDATQDFADGDSTINPDNDDERVIVDQNKSGRISILDPYFSAFTTDSGPSVSLDFDDTSPMINDFALSMNAGIDFSKAKPKKVKSTVTSSKSRSRKGKVSKSQLFQGEPVFTHTDPGEFHDEEFFSKTDISKSNEPTPSRNSGKKFSHSLYSNFKDNSDNSYQEKLALKSILQTFSKKPKSSSIRRKRAAPESSSGFLASLKASEDEKRNQTEEQDNDFSGSPSQKRKKPNSHVDSSLTEPPPEIVVDNDTDPFSIMSMLNTITHQAKLQDRERAGRTLSIKRDVIEDMIQSTRSKVRSGTGKFQFSEDDIDISRKNAQGVRLSRKEAWKEHSHKFHGSKPHGKK